MIADAGFGEARGRVRPLRFARRPSIPLEAACLVANGIRETLRELFGETCELAIGEPAAIDVNAWASLARDALLFLTRGRQTDIVLVLPRTDARRLVLRAFGEREDAADAPLPDAACSALEAHALERIAARCAVAFDSLCAERRMASQAVAAHEVPACVAYFDVRVRAPISLAIGIGIVRELPGPGPSGSLSPRALDAVGVEIRAVFADGVIDMTSFVELRPGDIVKLNTKVGAPASLNLAGKPFARGVAGVRGAHAAFVVSDVPTGVLRQ